MILAAWAVALSARGLLTQKKLTLARLITHRVAFTSMFHGQLISLGSREFGQVDAVAAGEAAVHGTNLILQGRRGQTAAAYRAFLARFGDA